LCCGEAIRQEPREGRIRKYGRARRHRGRPPQRNPKGRGLLRRGFVERLARIADAGRAILLPTPQNPSGAAIQAGLSLLLAANAQE